MLYLATVMHAPVCIYCGEPISATGNALSRNPGLCASCSSIADGMDEMIPAKGWDVAEQSVPSEEEAEICGAS